MSVDVLSPAGPIIRSAGFRQLQERRKEFVEGRDIAAALPRRAAASSASRQSTARSWRGAFKNYDAARKAADASSERYKKQSTDFTD